MLSSIPSAELGINGTDHFEGKFISPLGTWEDYTIGSYLVLVCEYSFTIKHIHGRIQRVDRVRTPPPLEITTGYSFPFNSGTDPNREQLDPSAEVAYIANTIEPDQTAPKVAV